jgi:hypothetical protein
MMPGKYRSDLYQWFDNRARRQIAMWEINTSKA